jgi:hypothetical protein
VKLLMRTALVGVVLGALLLPSPAVAQGPEKNTAITGWPPYTFGADLATILPANSTLKKGCTSGDQRIQEPPGWLCLEGRVDAPISGRAYPAIISLWFFEEQEPEKRRRLEMVVLTWVFESPISRRMSLDALVREVHANYGPELYRGETTAVPSEKENPVIATLWQDAQGKRLAIVYGTGQPTLLLTYTSAWVAGMTPPAAITPSAVPPAKY